MKIPTFKADKKEAPSTKSFVRSTRQQILKTLRNVIFWGIGLTLLFLAFRGQDLSQLWETMQGADYRWALLVLFITILSHFFRAWRWMMLIRPLQFRPSTYHTFLALMFGYLVNYAVPRLGEISRCASLQKTEKVPMEQLLGTVVSERAVDLLCLAIVTLLAFLLQFEAISDFFILNIFLPIGNILGERFLQSWAWLVGIAFLGMLLLGLGWLYRKRLMQFFLARKVLGILAKIAQGATTILKMEHKWLFLLYTVAIWFSYLLMTYLWFFSFEETSHLPMSAGLVLMVIGSLGRTLPIQGGGIGAYHYLFTQGALLFGIAETYGIALAVIIHGFQTLYYLIVGGISTLLLMLKKH